MNGIPMYKVIETTAWGETWWNVVPYDSGDDVDERNVFGSFTKSIFHAQIFCALMNLSHQQCRNLENI